MSVSSAAIEGQVTYRGTRTFSAGPVSSGGRSASSGTSTPETPSKPRRLEEPEARQHPVPLANTSRRKDLGKDLTSRDLSRLRRTSNYLLAGRKRSHRFTGAVRIPAPRLAVSPVVPAFAGVFGAQGSKQGSKRRVSGCAAGLKVVSGLWGGVGLRRRNVMPSLSREAAFGRVSREPLRGSD
jgi:hypothetical protein